MMSRMPGSRASSRSGRSTRRMRSDLSGRSAGNISASRQSHETPTMKKSSTFHRSRKYGGILTTFGWPCSSTSSLLTTLVPGPQQTPKETILRSISHVKAAVKKRLSPVR